MYVCCFLFFFSEAKQVGMFVPVTLDLQASPKAELNVMSVINFDLHEVNLKLVTDQALRCLIFSYAL